MIALFFYFITKFCDWVSTKIPATSKHLKIIIEKTDSLIFNFRTLLSECSEFSNFYHPFKRLYCFSNHRVHRQNFNNPFKIYLHTSSRFQTGIVAVGAITTPDRSASNWKALNFITTSQRYKSMRLLPLNSNIAPRYFYSTLICSGKRYWRKYVDVFNLTAQ